MRPAGFFPLVLLKRISPAARRTPALLLLGGSVDRPDGRQLRCLLGRGGAGALRQTGPGVFQVWRRGQTSRRLCQSSLLWAGLRTIVRDRVQLVARLGVHRSPRPERPRCSVDGPGPVPYRPTARLWLDRCSGGPGTGAHASLLWSRLHQLQGYPLCLPFRLDDGPAAGLPACDRQSLCKAIFWALCLA